MKFVDFTPSTSPSFDEQRDALQKGLGRSWSWASSGALADAALLEACVHDKRFDQQCEDSRSNWLWSLVQQIGAQETFRDPILQALCELKDERSANQLCELAGHYAGVGDTRFRSRLYEIVESKPIADSPWLGEEQIIAFDGMQAFLFAARVRGERLATIAWEWDDGTLASDAAERFGEQCIVNLLTASSDAGVRRFLENWQDQKERKPARKQSHRDRMQSVSIADILEAAHGTDRCFWLRGWGMHADESDLERILAALWSADDSNVISRLLRVFSKRPLPRFDPRLIDLCQHDDEEVQKCAYAALSNNADTAIRRFALRQLDTAATGEVIGLFIKNFERGDEVRIQESMRLPDDPCELHWMLMDVIKVLEANPAADCFQLALIAYGAMPCQNCRFDAVRLLRSQKAAPRWLIKECRFDAEERCRQLFEVPAIE